MAYLKDCFKSVLVSFFELPTHKLLRACLRRMLGIGRYVPSQLWLLVSCGRTTCLTHKHVKNVRILIGR